MSEKIDDRDFNGFYSPNVDIRVENGKISANYNFYASEEEKQAYFKKYGVSYPYKTSTEFRRMVYDYVMWYLDDFVKKANNGDIESLQASPLWRAINSTVGAVTAVESGVIVYDAIKCCKEIYAQIGFFIDVQVKKEVGKGIKKIVVKWKDDFNNFKNPKQDRLVDNIHYNAFNALIDGETVNFKTIYTSNYDDEHPDRAVQSSLLKTDLFVGADVLKIDWSGIANLPQLDNTVLKSDENSIDYLNLQHPLETVEQSVVTMDGGRINIELITLENKVDDYGKETTTIKSQYSIGDGLELPPDEQVFTLRLNKTHFEPESVLFSDIRKNSIGKEHLIAESVDEGNIAEGTVENYHFKPGQIIRGRNYPADSIKPQHIPDGSLLGDSLGSLRPRNINASISENIRGNIESNLRLMNLKDYQGNTEQDSVHFTKNHREKLNQLKIFGNKVVSEAERVDIAVSIDDNPDEGCKLALARNYFNKFRNTIKSVEDKGNGIGGDLDTVETRYRQVLRDFQYQEGSKCTIMHPFAGDLKISKLGEICCLNGLLSTQSTVGNPFDVSYERKLAYLPYNEYSSHYSIRRAFIDEFGEYIYFICFRGGEIILEKVVDWNGNRMKEIGKWIKFNIDFEYIHV